MITVAVTGWAVRTALGHTIDDLYQRLCAGERAAAVNPRFPAQSYACHLAAAITGDPRRSPHDRILRRAGRFAYHAALEALAMSGARPGVRLGLFSGVGGLRAHWNELMPALKDQRDDLQDSWQSGFRRIHPYWMLQHLSNNTHALLSKDVDARGEGVTFGGANAGAQAMAAAQRALADHAIDAALIVAYDSLIEPETVVEMAARGAAATCPLDELRAPYDRAANGAVPGEAAAALVLEPIDTAARRALAYVSANDGAGATADLADTRALAAIAGQVARGDERVLDGAGLGIPAADSAERATLARLVLDTGDSGDSRERAPLTALQAALGQIGAAASLVQTAVLARALALGRVPAIAGLAQPAPGPLLPLTEPRATTARAALAVSMGAPGLIGVVRVALDP